jgi:hypothetical protein
VHELGSQQVLCASIQLTVLVLLPLTCDLADTPCTPGDWLLCCRRRALAVYPVLLMYVSIGWLALVKS